MLSRRVCCCTGPTKFCLTACSGIPVYGATIQLYSAGVLVDSCTTDSTGCCTFAETGTFDVRTVISGTSTDFGNRTLSGAAINLSQPTGSGLICCAGYYIPKTLTLTDAIGTLTFAYSPALSSTFPTWGAARDVTRTNTIVVTEPGGICTPGAIGTGPTGVCYQMSCISSNSPKFSMKRFWSKYQNGPGGTWYYYNDTSTPLTCVSDTCISFDSGSSGQSNPSTTTPFAISFTMAFSTFNNLSDPVGGNVSVSQ